MKQFFLIAIMVASPIVAQAATLNEEGEVVYESLFHPFERCDGVVMIDGMIDDPTYSGLVSFTIHGGLTFVERYEHGVAISYSYFEGTLEEQQVDENWVGLLDPEDEIYVIRDDFFISKGYRPWSDSGETWPGCGQDAVVAEAETEEQVVTE